MINTVFDYLEDSFLKYPEKVAIVYGEHKLTYRQFYTSALRIAGWINKYLDVYRQPIIILMKNSDIAIESFFGVALSGNIYVPLDVHTPRERLKAISKILSPALVINCELNDENYAECFRCKIVSWEEIQESDCNGEECLRRRNEIIDMDPLYILFTSGSTGTPKGVLVSHRSVIDFTEEITETMEFSENEIFLNQAPFYFDASVPDIFCTIRNGATLHIVDRTMFAFPIKLMDYISTYKINAIFWVPSALVMVANFKVLQKRNISTLKKVMFCGEVMPVKQLNMWMDALPETQFVNYYGPCEATYACSYYIVDRRFEDDEIIPIGRACRNTNIFIISEGKAVNKPGEIGELYVRGTGVALGYYNDYERTKDRFVQNPLQNYFHEIVYRTGDLAHYDENNNMVYDGRMDYQIKHMGYRIELGEIEANVISIKGIEQAACIYKTEKIICYYVGSVNEKIVLEEVGKKLPFYMIPQKIIKIGELPMNMNGKIDRQKLISM